MFEQLIKQVMQEEFGATRVSISHRLLGGMSNYTYVINADDKKYTFRVPGEFAENFVDRNIEKANIPLFEELGITNKTLYLNTETGIKVARYIDGTPLNQLDLKDYPYELVSKKLKTIHNSNLKAVNDYDPFGRLELYESYLLEDNYKHCNKYLTLKKDFLKYKPYLENQPKVLCHGDSQPSNFVSSGDDLIVVDFEFTGNIDLLYDIACFGNMDFACALELVKHYYGENINNEIYKRLYLWRTFQALQWYNVAIFKDIKGLSKKLKIDFKKVSEHYLNVAETLMSKLHKFK